MPAAWAICSSSAAWARANAARRRSPAWSWMRMGRILSYDIETQVRSVFQNVKWILEDSGSSWEKIVDVTVYLTNMKDDFPTYNRLWKEYFENDPPCRTTLEINCLPTPIAIELKVVATV
jgi:2-aminomuconate deaminase